MAKPKLPSGDPTSEHLHPISDGDGLPTEIGAVIVIRLRKAHLSRQDVRDAQRIVRRGRGDYHVWEGIVPDPWDATPEQIAAAEEAAAAQSAAATALEEEAAQLEGELDAEPGPVGDGRYVALRLSARTDHGTGVRSHAAGADGTP